MCCADPMEFSVAFNPTAPSIRTPARRNPCGRSIPTRPAGAKARLSRSTCTRAVWVLAVSIPTPKRCSSADARAGSTGGGRGAADARLSARGRNARGPVLPLGRGSGRGVGGGGFSDAVSLASTTGRSVVRSAWIDPAATVIRGDAGRRTT